MPGRPDETPVRRRTDVQGSEPSPGTPAPGSIVRPEDRFTFLRIANATIQKYARRFGRIIGSSQAAPVDAYVSDVVPALALNQFDPEFRYPEDGLYQGIIEQPAGVNVSIIELVMPANATKLAIIESLKVVRLTSAGAVIMTTEPAASPLIQAGLARVGNLIQRDSRMQGTWQSNVVQSQLQIWAGNLAAPVFGPFGHAFYSPAILTPDVAAYPFILSPGNALVLAPVTTTAPLTTLAAEGFAVVLAVREVELT